MSHWFHTKGATADVSSNIVLPVASSETTKALLKSNQQCQFKIRQSFTVMRMVQRCLGLVEH